MWNKLDPSRTRLLRLKALRASNKRFKKFARAVREFVGTNDEFALGAANTFQLSHKATYEMAVANRLMNRRRYQFMTNPNKMRTFRQWLQQQINATILAPVGGDPNKPWTAPFIESAYSKGLLRSYLQVNKQNLQHSPAFFSGTQEAFLRQSFALPITREKIEILMTRSFNGMQGISQSVGSQLNRILAEGLVKGSGPGQVARDMTKAIGKISRTRARVIARTEIVYAQAEGQLDAYERLGVTKVAAKVEWSTAGDALVCPDCDAMEGTVYTVKQAHGLIPLHPNCRCAWLPV